MRDMFLLRFAAPKHLGRGLLGAVSATSFWRWSLCEDKSDGCLGSKLLRLGWEAAHVWP